MNKDSEANEEKPKVKRVKARTKSYVDAGPPQSGEDATITSQPETGSKQLDVEATPTDDVVDAGTAPAAPTEP